MKETSAAERASNRRRPSPPARGTSARLPHLVLPWGAALSPDAVVDPQPYGCVLVRTRG
jgi:ABC-type uncharacterized transport system involved in gliding motility auxiliary subunit